MLFEIQVLAWDGHKNVIGLNWLTRSQFLSCCEHMFFHLFLVPCWTQYFIANFSKFIETFPFFSFYICQYAHKS
jgi:hypothetical protein